LDEAGIQLQHARDLAIVELGQHLTKVHRAERLNNLADSPRFSKFHAVWKLSLPSGGEHLELLILVGDVFPFEPPQLRFSDASLFLRFPHVDDKGKLCLTNAAATFSPNQITETIDFLIDETRKLIADSIAGKNEDDFIQEFQNYWRCLPAFSPKKFWSLLKPAQPTRGILYYPATGFTLYGESEEEIRVWLRNYNGGTLPKGFKVKPSILVWLKEPLSPRSYPRTARAILDLARNSTPNSEALLLSAIPRELGSLPMVLGFDSKNGPILAGVEAFEPKIQNRSNPTKRLNSRNIGYRPGHVPGDILLPRYFGEGKVTLSDIERVDPAWCLQRGGNGYTVELFRKRVAIVGCGSLGADIALMLAKSSIGRFVLVDSDSLSWGNVVRHVLGGDYAGQGKASALAQHLTKQMPWLETSDETASVETLIYERPRVLSDCDLIISTTGDWTCDCLLNGANRTSTRFPPVIFGWTEPYGIAGHALGVLPQGGCLACGMSEFGVFNSRVSEWSEGNQPLVQAAGCSDLYQPYGVADVAPIKSVIAELALDILSGRVRESTLRTWMGDVERLKFHMSRGEG
jgi:molybdopterin/thiamine biosynthesis adenylyltransferase